MSEKLSQRCYRSQSDESEVSQTALLTRTNLSIFNELAVKPGSGKAPSTMSASASLASSPVATSASRKTISSTSSGFAIQAYRNGILDKWCSKAPINLEELRVHFTQSRSTSPPPSNSVFDDYTYRVGSAFNQPTTVVESSLILLKRYEGRDYRRTFNHAFTGFPNNVGLNNKLSPPQPDFVEGLELSQYSNLPVETLIQGSVLYQDNPHSIVLPHIAGEWKGPGKDMMQAELQSSYVGAALMFARTEALVWLGKCEAPGHAAVTTFTTDGTKLNIFAHHAAMSEDGELQYHQYPIISFDLLQSHQEFEDGCRALRNAQDYARQQSFALRDQLKERWKQARSGHKRKASMEL